MTSLLIAAPGPFSPGPFSIVTTASGGSPAWKALLNWPRFGETHIDYAADTPRQRDLWAARLDEAVRHADKPVLLIASGESCSATAWWARLSPADYVSRVAGALLFAPRGASGEADLLASPRTPLPFPSAVVGRRAGRRARILAQGWGSGLLEDGLHVEGDNAWQQAQTLVMRLTARVVEREMRVAGAFDIAG